MSTKLEENNINYQFKLLYAIGIVMIVANHTSGNGGISLFYELFPAASFEIGLFVFTSGYFYKEKYEEDAIYDEGDLLDLVKDDKTLKIFLDTVLANSMRYTEIKRNLEKNKK